MKRQNMLRIFGLVSFLYFFTLPGQAQEMQSLYFMRLPQANLMNPASHLYCNFYLDLPVLGSANVTTLGNRISFSDLVFPGMGEYADSLITILHPTYNIDDFLNKLDKKNYIAPSAHINILSLGFKAKNLYFHINFAENTSVFLGLPKDFMTLVFKGNDSFAGNKADFSSFGLRATTYGSYGLGVTADISPALTIGVRGKFLSGIADLSLKNKGMSIGIDGDSYNHTLQADLTVNASAPLEVKKDSAGNITDVTPKEEELNGTANLFYYLINPVNPGFAFDFGTSYRINDRFSLSASVLDLGMIFWKRDINNFSSKGEFVFKGLDASPVFQVNDTTTLEDVANNLLDSLQSVFEPVHTTDPYTTTLNPKIYFGGTFHLNDAVYLGLLSRTEIHKKNILQSFTLSANASVSRFLDATVTYSYSNHSFNNIGAGLSLRGGPLQIFVLTDYVLGFIHPDEASSLGVWLGVNLTFGCRGKSLSDTPLIW